MTHRDNGPTPHRIMAGALFVLSIVIATGCSDSGVAAPVQTAVSLDEDCNPLYYTDGCNDPVPVVTYPELTGGIALAAYPDMASCGVTAGSDADGDGVNDGCELAIARTFAPLLAQSPVESDFEPWRGLVGGEYYFGVTQMTVPVGSPATNFAGLRIAYMPAYYVDLGTGSTIEDALGGAGHAGDSEFIMVDVVPHNGSWIFIRAFLSAHCGSNFLDVVSTAPNCQWWNADMFPQFSNNIHNGAPVVWVSDRKHAMYYSFSACENTIINQDTCDGTRALAEFPVTDGFNVGSATHNLGSVTARRGSPNAVAGALENLWALSIPFGGWQNRITDTTSYGKILTDFGF